MLGKKRLAGVAVAVAVFITMAGLVTQWAFAQGEDISSVVARLADEGVTIKASAMTGSHAEVTIQSASSTDVGTPDDPLSINRTQREFVLAKSRGMNIESLKITVVNANGQVLSYGEIPLEETISASWSNSPKLTETATEQGIRDQLGEAVPFTGVSLDSLLVDEDKDETRVLSLNLSATDPAAANKSWAELMIHLYRIVNQTNRDQGAQIGLVRVDLADQAGDLLFKYVYDVQRGEQSWWQAPGMTKDWFETPS